MTWLDFTPPLSKDAPAAEREKALTYYKLVLLLSPIGYAFVVLYTFVL